MSRTWRSDDQPVRPVLRLRDWPRVVLRAVPLGVVVFGGLGLLLTLRLAERPLCGERRPLSPLITSAVCRLALLLTGLRREVTGTPLRGRAAGGRAAGGVVVANHQSWLDILALNAGQRLTFVAKSEVAGWPGIGWLARATGTVFVRRDRGQLTDQIATLRARLAAGHLLALFPEGTSTDGAQVLPFRPALFAALCDLAPRDPAPCDPAPRDPAPRDPAPCDLAPCGGVPVQPVTLCYVPPTGIDRRFYGWWGDMAFAPHLLLVLAARGRGVVRVTYHPPLAVPGDMSRKALAATAEAMVRAGLPAGMPAVISPSPQPGGAAGPPDHPPPRSRPPDR